MKKRAKHISTILIGFSFLMLGITGLFVPFLQGILFLLIGLYLLSKTSPLAKRILNHLRSRFPRLARQLDQIASRGFMR